jgi:predicted ABC-type ATPase
MPVILLIAGPNGAGKTTFARQLAKSWPEAGFLNADEVVQEVPAAVEPKTRNFRAGRITIGRLNALIEAGTDIILETTLAGRTYPLAIPRWRSRGYETELYYLRLPRVEVCLERIARRVAAGGHDIPEADARRRFIRSLEAFEGVKWLVDTWYLFDSLEGRFDLVLAGENHEPQADRD